MFPGILEAKISKVDRLYHFTSQLNKVILRIADEEALFKEACRIAIDKGGFKLAWIGIINEKTKIPEPLIYEGADVDFLSIAKIIFDENISVRNYPFLKASSKEKSVVINDTEAEELPDLLRTELLKRGYLSVISMPLHKSGKVTGVFTLYADKKNFFDKEEITFLEDAAGDISFALDVFEKEALRKKAEQAIVDSSRHYETLAEMSPVGIFHTDETGYTTYVNPRWCQISGLSYAEALGNGWLTVVHEDDREKLMAGWETATKKLMLSTSEYRFVRRDGSIAWVMGQAVPEINSTNEVVGYIGTITDITQFKITEEKIKRSNTQLSLSQQIAHIGYWELSLCEEPGYWSDEMYRLFDIQNNGMPMDLNSYIQHVHPDDRELLLEAHRSVIEDKSQLNIEFRFIKDHGNICIFYSLGKVITNKDGKPLMLMGITQDITERKKSENEILKEKQLLDSIINSLPGAFYLYTKEGRFLRWNKNFEKITKYSTDEIKNMHPLDFFYGNEKTVITQKIGNTFLYGEENVEANFYTKTKEKVPYYFTGIAIDYEGVTCLMGVGIDISARVEAQEKIKQTSEQLRQLALHLQTIREGERKRIGREIHDELGQQLTAIKMDVAWIDKKIGPEIKPVKDKLKNIIDLLDGSNKSIRRILSELRSGILDDHDLPGAIELLGKKFSEISGIPVHYSFPEKGINATEPIGNCIFRLCQEAFTNITRHSKASNVSVSLQIQDDTVTAIVEDDGIGFNVSLVQYNKSFGILGMKERVLSLGGEFELISSPGAGTKIALRLPYISSQNN